VPKLSALCWVFGKPLPCTPYCVSGARLQVLGAALRERDKQDWNRLIEKLRNGALAAESDTAAIQRICAPSYNCLPISLKRCFVTFAAYPEDARIDEAELISLWATHEAVAHWSNIEIARQRLDDLAAACLVRKDGGWVYMHDILRDLAAAQARTWGCWFIAHEVRPALMCLIKASV
jgi:hypothetical protein